MTPGVDDDARSGTMKVRLGLGSARSHRFTTGQCPVMTYHRSLMTAILHDRVHIAKAVNATVVGLDDAPRGYGALTGVRPAGRSQQRDTRVAGAPPHPPPCV